MVVRAYMKKQELIHIHGLLTSVKNQYDEWGYEVDLSDYKETNVEPTSIHKPKGGHKEAVYHLAEALGDPTETKSDDHPLEEQTITAD